MTAAAAEQARQVGEIQNCGRSEFPNLTAETQPDTELRCESFFPHEDFLDRASKVKPLARSGSTPICNNTGCVYFDITNRCSRSPALVSPTLPLAG